VWWREGGAGKHGHGLMTGRGMDNAMITVIS
jgi:hypothetical protein